MGLLVDLRPLRTRDLRLLMLGGNVSLLGSMVTRVAVPFQVYSMTRSTIAVGLVGACQLGPLLLVSLVGGALADAHDRRRIAAWCNAGLILTSLLLLANASSGAPSLLAIYALVTVAACLSAIEHPTIAAIYPRLVATEELAAVSALMGLLGSFAMVVGPTIAGLVLADAGLKVAYAVDAGTFVLALVAIVAIRPVPPLEDAESASLRSIVDGFRFLRGRQVLQATYLIDTVAMVFGMSAALFPAVVAARYGGDPRALGLLYAAPSAGAFLVSVLSGWTTRVRRQGLGLVAAATAWGVAIVVFGLAGPLWLALSALAAAGASDMVSGIFRMTIWNVTIPDSHRGRLAGITWANVTSGPALGDVEAGVLAAFAGVSFAIVSGGVACIVGVLALAAAMPRVLDYEHPGAVTAKANP